MNFIPSTRAGFVAIIGEPNVGKSTLLNAMLGTKLSSVTPKPQTTRKTILGIYTDDNDSTSAAASLTQPQPLTHIVFYDTPGVLNPRYGLQSTMMDAVRQAVEGADALLVVLDVMALVSNRPKLKRSQVTKASRRDASQATYTGRAALSSGEDTVRPQLQALYAITSKLKTSFESMGKPVIVALNKMDMLHDKKQALPVVEALLQTGVVHSVFTISALQNKFVQDLLQALKALMPEHELYYDAELLSEAPQRFFVAEMIREVIFGAYSEEIPYATEVSVVEFKERETGKWYISAEVIVERDTQKAIIIGKQGAKLKAVGALARAAIEEYLELPVYLELYVKVREDWRDNPTYLRAFGYGGS